VTKIKTKTAERFLRLSPLATYPLVTQDPNSPAKQLKYRSRTPDINQERKLSQQPNKRQHQHRQRAQDRAANEQKSEVKRAAHSMHSMRPYPQPLRI
jgi:hypothetical protein